ncbi:MAG: TIR domain-containing protein [Anaerolineales bacterium]|nr:MAG: TIR domain-containing protein [Anaerolineales bacterium]
MIKPTVFISYSHKDEHWKDRLRPHLGVLEQQDRITIWDDRQIDAGATWYDEIRKAMEQAAVTVCLISADYLASDFCVKEEIPYLLERCKNDGMTLIPLLVRPCLWRACSWLKPIQMIPRDGQSIAEDFQGREDGVFVQVAERIFEVIDEPAPMGIVIRAAKAVAFSEVFVEPTEALAEPSMPPERMDIGRLPMTGAELFGRQRELELLDEAWQSENTHIVSLVAWGGVGKSTLLNKWLERMEADNYRGARRVYAWSFYSQGSGERVASADLFISEALTWFGDPDPTAGSPWDKGQRLADLIRQEKTLLLLDGMEPLQSHLQYERGKVKDPALAMLLAELARHNPGLCVITTREKVADLTPFPETTRQEDLEQISAEAGRALLRVSGVQGADAELEQAARDFGQHALALNLLAAYLREIPGHFVANASGIPDLDVLETEGKHPRRVMAAFAARFGGGPEVELLRMLGLFDRPAKAEEIAALRAAPPIPGLTEHIQPLSEAGWLRLLDKLRQARLIAPQSRHLPDTLYAHPLVREHFGQQLQQEHPEAWREGHNRLYEHLKAAAKEYPDTIEEMAPLYAAVAHGCQAGRHQEALDEVFCRRMDRGEAFVARKLGAMGAVLAALSGLFDPPWRQPVEGLREASKGFVLNVAGFCLQALGRLAEAAQPIQAALGAAIAQEDWENAARRASNLSELTLTSGDLVQALEFARQSVDLADRSGVWEQRMINRTTLADALHQAGRLPEAEAAFREAEEMQKEKQSQYPLLYSLRGFRYCDLLLGQGRYQDVLSRAGQTLKWVTPQNWLLDIALDHLSLGRAHLLQARQEGTGDFTQAAAHLNQAVDGLRQAGQQDELPRGLLARAELRRVMGSLDRARADLEEALSIATRGGMRLYEADCHLEYVRLHLACGDKEKARQSLAKAKQMIEDMGYHRRDGEVAALEEMLQT